MKQKTTIIEALNKLPVKTEPFIKQIISKDELFNLIMDEVSSKPAKELQFKNIGAICETAYAATTNYEKITKFDPGIEDFILKTSFLISIVGCEEILINSLIEFVDSPYQLVFELDCILDSNIHYQFLMKMYKRYREELNSLQVLAKQYANFEQLMTEKEEVKEILENFAQKYTINETTK